MFARVKTNAATSFEVGDNALERTRKVAPVPLPRRLDHIVPAAD